MNETLSEGLERPDKAPTGAARSARYPNLDILRLWLATAVIARHTLHIYDGYSLLSPIPAVAGFICLSGLLIPESFTRSRNWGHFAWKRLLRVVPAFTVSLALVARLFGLGALPTTLYYYVTMSIGTLGTFNSPLWSLMVEEILYTFHCLLRTLTKRWTVRMAWGCLLLGSLAWVGLVVFHVRFPHGSDRVVPPVTSFFAGNVAMFHKDRFKAWGWTKILAALVGAIALRSFYPEPIVFTPLVCVLAVMLAYNLPQVKFQLPDFSYGLYVYHWPIMLVFLPHGPRMTFALTYSCALALAAVSWYLVERPALRLKDWKGPFSEARVLG